MEIVLWVIGTEVLATGLLILTGLWHTSTRRPFDAPWDGYRGKRQAPATPDRDWVIA